MYNHFNVEVNYQDIAIGGKMITASVTIADAEMMREYSMEESKEELRRYLVEQLASAILDKQLCEITQIKEVSTFSTRVAARCYVAPNEQVKLLRKAIVS
jgi:hypothetical protein